MKAILILVLVVAIIYGGAKFATIYKSKDDLTRRVEYQLDFVDEKSMDQVKADLVHDAQRFGIELLPENINIVYEDTDKRTLPQKMVEGKVAEFTNKQVAIDVHYVARLLGYPLKQEIVRTKIKQIQVRRAEKNRELLPDLDSGL